MRWRRGEPKKVLYSKMLRGELNEVKKFDEALQALGLEPSKYSDVGSVSLKTYYIQNTGPLYLIRIWFDRRAGEGTIKVRIAHDETKKSNR